MPNPEHLRLLRSGVGVWNEWRFDFPEIVPDLAAADLHATDLRGFFLNKANLDNADLRDSDLASSNLGFAQLNHSNLKKANLTRANLNMASLRGADLTEANMSLAYLYLADFTGATLEDADITQADLGLVNFEDANLRGANLSLSSLVEASVENADLTNCCVYGLSVWNVQGRPGKQANLIITREDEPTITVDNIEIAQFVYLLVNNEKIRDVIDTVGRKAVLILGRFTARRKAILEALREELRNRDYAPILFDFTKPATRDITETITILAHMSRFIIADITDAKSIPQELQAIVPHIPSVPVQPLLLRSQREYGMFEHFKAYPWVMEPFLYTSKASLLKSLQTNVIAPAEAKAQELNKPR